ncbi:MAG: DHH family phosphoesterase, partial [Bacteroidales bacterium]|nr:DHH family phosphoesterase [Bacteroidales bacterium]
MIQIPENKINQLKQFLHNANSIAIVSHTNPDGDTIGSALAMSFLLRKLDKKTTVIVPDEVPEFLTFLHGITEIIDFSKNPDLTVETLNQSDILLCVDFNATHRTSKLSPHLDAFSGPKLMIDHHISPDEDFFDLLFSFVESSSTSELIFHLIQQSGWLHLIDNDIAQPLFVGIMTDTGSYAHSADRPEVFTSSAQLIELGNLKVKEIHDLVYNNFKENRLRFLGFCISEKLVVIKSGLVAYIWVTNKDMKRFNVSEGDLEGVVNYALSIAGVELAVLFKEKYEHIKLSFRSRKSFDVNKFA